MPLPLPSLRSRTRSTNFAIHFLCSVSPTKNFVVLADCGSTHESVLRLEVLQRFDLLYLALCSGQPEVANLAGSLEDVSAAPTERVWTLPELDILQELPSPIVVLLYANLSRLALVLLVKGLGVLFAGLTFSCLIA